MERHEQINQPRVKIFINNFIGGLAWALGATVGLALIIAILTLILKNASLVPFIGSFVADIVKFVITKNPNLLSR
ncbi:MAG: DUF5665 domain-containing protein [Candidatus Levyibacteriota bacterium]|jgi:hypothetical protein